MFITSIYAANILHKLPAGVALMAEIEGPYTPELGTQQVPLPAQKRWISR